MEINKMLTLCTSHVTDQTLRLLDKDATGNNFPCLGIYKKEDYGYFIYIDKKAFCEQKACSPDSLPADLVAVIAFTIEAGCDILCLDGDGEELVCLPHYEYHRHSDIANSVSDELCYCGGKLLSETILSYYVP